MKRSIAPSLNNDWDIFCRVEVLPFDSDLVHETLEGDFGELYDDEDDSNGW